MTTQLDPSLSALAREAIAHADTLSKFGALVTLPERDAHDAHAVRSIERISRGYLEAVEENERLRRAIETALKGSPTEDPGRYEGDNHGDSFTSGWEHAEWATAKILRAALSSPSKPSDTGSVADAG